MLNGFGLFMPSLQFTNMITCQRQLSRNFKQLCGFSTSSAASSKKEKHDEKRLSKEEATNKLNDLLKLMVQKDNEHPAKDVKLAQAIKQKREKPKKEASLGEKLAVAAKDVATSLGGDVEKTESELLNILLRRSDPSTQGLKDVLSGIKVERTSDPRSRAEQVRAVLDKPKAFSEPPHSFSRDRSKPQKRGTVTVNLMDITPSTYFKDLQPQPAPCELRTWQSCMQRDMRLATTHPPGNIYDQMVLWTNQGMLWKFPIDNEQGLDSEKQVPFEDHIFMENHLEGWCPERGPVRHFMELVCVGLSKNSWLTVEEKKNHIMWYRDFFADKQSLLKELGVGTVGVEETKPQETTQ